MGEPKGGLIVKNAIAAIIIVILALLAAAGINHFTSNPWGAIGGGFLAAFFLWIIWEEIAQ